MLFSCSSGRGVGRLSSPEMFIKDQAARRAVASVPAGKSLSMVSLYGVSKEPAGDPPSLGGTREDYITGSSLIIH